jgi:hypothetical protein
MPPNPTSSVASRLPFRKAFHRVLGAMSVFTMLMTLSPTPTC